MAVDWSNFSKQELIDAIHRMEKNPDKKAEILADLGFAAAGGGAGAIGAAFLGASSTAIPIITGLTGATITVAASPVVIGAGAVVGAGALIGMIKLGKNTGKHEGKRQEILRELKEKLRDFEKKERSTKVSEHDKIKLYSLLAKAMEEELISKKDSADLMEAVERGEISLQDACQTILKILHENNKQ